MSQRTRSPKPAASPSRRTFLITAGSGVAATAVAGGFPSIVPSSVLGAASPSNRITVGAIGTGRISRGHDLPGIWRHGTRAAQRSRLDAGVVSGDVRPPLAAGDPLADWPDIRLPRGTARDLIDEGRGEA